MGDEKSPRVPFLSVVVPVYGVEAYLADCLESILRDQHADIEVLAVDDHSPDRSGEIADEYAGRDARVRVVHLSTNVGLGPARNVGLEHAAGEYVWFVDSDDRLPDGTIPAVVGRLASSRPDVLIVDHAEVFEDGRPTRRPASGPLPVPTSPVRLSQCPQLLQLAQSACTKVVRRAFLAGVGLRFSPGWYEDCAFSHALLMAADRIDVLDRVCYFYRQRRAGGITKTTSARHFEVFDQYQRLFEFVDTAPAYDRFRPELFRIMIDHYLVIVGNRQRVPAPMRPAFFRRIVSDFRTRLPAGGYQAPGGVAGVKHWLVRHGAYPVYATLRRLHHATVALRARGRSNGDQSRKR